jgi:hypothetical protein
MSAYHTIATNHAAETAVEPFEFEEDIETSPLTPPTSQYSPLVRPASVDQITDSLHELAASTPAVSLFTDNEKATNQSISVTIDRNECFGISNVAVVADRFEGFMKLPRELRQKIIRDAMKFEKGRLIYVEETGLAIDAYNPACKETSPLVRRCYSSRIEVIGAKAPNMAIAINEVADYLVRAGIYKPLFRTHDGESAVFFNENLDVVVVRTHLPDFGLSPRLLFADCVVNHHDLSLVTRLSFSVANLLRFHVWTAANFNSFENLKELQLMGKYVDQLRVGGKFVLEMEFRPEYVWDGLMDASGRMDIKFGMKPFYIINGITYANQAALHAAYQGIQDPSEQQRVMDIYAILNDMVRRGVNVPLTKLFITFTAGALASDLEEEASTILRQSAA